MNEIVSELLNSSVFNIVVGSLLTFTFAFLLNKLSRKDEYRTRIVEKRIEYYERLNLEMIPLTLYRNNDGKSEITDDCKYLINSGIKKLYGYPEFFSSTSQFLEVKKNLAIISSSSRIFLSENLYNRIFFLDSYLSKIFDLNIKYPTVSLPYIGFLLSDEIEKMYNEIDSEIVDFFRNDYKFKFVKPSIAKARDYEFKLYKNTDLFKMFFQGEFKCVECINEKCPIHEIKKTIAINRKNRK